MKQLHYHVISKYSSLFKFIFILALVMLLDNERLNAQNDLDVLKNNWIQYSDAPNSMYHFLTGEASKLLELRAGKIAQIKTKDELLQRQAEVQKTMWETLGPFPEKTPLNAKITGTPTNETVSVKSLFGCHQKIKSIELLGNKGFLKWRTKGDKVDITFPVNKNTDQTGFVLKVELI